MPGWHAKTKQLVADKKLLVAGIAPEQHGDRMALFLQWKQMEDMPVMVDSFNLFNLKAVPITLLIDESGIIRHRNPSDHDLATFLARPPAELGTAPTAPRLADGLIGIQPTAKFPWARKIEDLAKELTILGQPDWLLADHHFQLGVAFRKRYDSEKRVPSDFASAIEHWSTALKLDPTNYIWRRRLQQYGPLLDKPYPFYNWVSEARQVITARGDTPRPLVAEPGESERAIPAERPPEAGARPAHPDPDNKIPIDRSQRFLVSSAVIPHTSKPDHVLRVIIEITPNPAHQAKWNDEAGPSTAHVQLMEAWVAKPFARTLMPAKNRPLTSPRRVEFELHRRKASPEDNPAVNVDVFYHVCSGTEGVCQFLRQDVTVNLP